MYSVTNYYLFILETSHKHLIIKIVFIVTVVFINQRSLLHFNINCYHSHLAGGLQPLHHAALWHVLQDLYLLLLAGTLLSLLPDPHPQHLLGATTTIAMASIFVKTPRIIAEPFQAGEYGEQDNFGRVISSPAAAPCWVTLSLNKGC